MKDHERATQVWAVLALAARNRQILTYEILSQLIGVPAHGLANILDHVQRYCMQRGLPPLTSIVVSKSTGLPGEGFITAQDIPRNQGSVFNHDWITTAAPSPDDLETAVREARAR